MLQRRQELEDALSSLRPLIRDATTPEADFQAWFEKHPIAFAALGYVEHHPRPTLPLGGGRSLVPDFLAKRIDGTWEVVELKLPRLSVLKKRETRQTFYADMESYVEQCLDYSKYFSDRTHCTAFHSKSLISIEGRIKVKLVAGRANGLDRVKVLEKLADRGNWIDLLTYDDVHAHLEFLMTKTLPQYEGLPGLTVHFAGSLHRSRRSDRNYLVSVGASESHNAVSAFVDSKLGLCVEVRDADGLSHLFRTTKIGSLAGGRPTYLTFEVGLGRDHAVTSIEVDGRYHSVAIRDAMTLDLDPNAWVIGASCTGTGGGWFNFQELVVLGQTLTLADRCTIRDASAQLLTDPELEGREAMAAEFRNHFMRSNRHPNFSFDERYDASDLVQPEVHRQPRVPSRFGAGTIPVIYNQSRVHEQP